MKFVVVSFLVICMSCVGWNTSSKKKINKSLPTIDCYVVNETDTIKTVHHINDTLITFYNYSRPQNFAINTQIAPSKSQSSRVRFLIMHYTACNWDLAQKVLTQGEVSSHYLVNDKIDQDIHLLVDESKRAFHAGISVWQNFSNINDSSIGIEIVNLGFDQNRPNIFYSYPNHQVQKIAELAKAIINKHKILPQFVLGHSDVAPLRKSDPGPAFPWKKLFKEHQIGAWYDSIKAADNLVGFPQDSLNSFSFIKMVQQDFKTYGYSEMPVNGLWNKDAGTIIEKFQHHFRPERYDGILDAETFAILQNLIDKYIYEYKKPANVLKYQGFFDNPIVFPSMIKPILPTIDSAETHLDSVKIKSDTLSEVFMENKQEIKKSNILTIEELINYKPIQKVQNIEILNIIYNSSIFSDEKRDLSSYFEKSFFYINLQ